MPTPRTAAVSLRNHDHRFGRIAQWRRSGARALLLINAVLVGVGLSALLGGCAAQTAQPHQPHSGVAGFESTSFGRSGFRVAGEPRVSECLNVPLDLASDPHSAPAAEWVDDIRLGYSNFGGVFLSRPMCQIHGSALCRFVEAHEQAHHYTKTIGQSSQCAEVLADCWAAMHADEAAVNAAVAYFAVRRGSDTLHAEPQERADTIAQCSEMARSEIAKL